MNKEQVDKLLLKYEQGLTTSEEEANLVEQLSNVESNSKLWFQYIKKQKKSTPKKLEEDIWSAIQSERKGKTKKLFRFMSVAASVLLLVSILWFTNPLNKKEMSYEEKVAVLEEAQAMYSSIEEPKTIQAILYEDETIIIYLEN